MIYYDNDLEDLRPVPYPGVRHADIMWSKGIWREVDMRQKMNQSFYYPLEPHNNWRNFITVVMDALKEGSITAYDISNTDEFLVPLTYQEIMTRQIDTAHRTLTRPYPPYDQYDTVIFWNLTRDVYSACVSRKTGISTKKAPRCWCVSSGSARS